MTKNHQTDKDISKNNFVKKIKCYNVTEAVIRIIGYRMNQQILNLLIKLKIQVTIKRLVSKF